MQLLGSCWRYEGLRAPFPDFCNCAAVARGSELLCLPPCALTGAESDVVSPKTLYRVSKGLRCRYLPASPKSSAASRTSLPWAGGAWTPKAAEVVDTDRHRGYMIFALQEGIEHVQTLAPSPPPCAMIHA